MKKNQPLILHPMKMQLNKYLAWCGIASRRKTNVPISRGRVMVNGKVVNQLGLVIDSETDEILLDGKKVFPPGEFRYILLNKPANVITSAEDSRGRKTVLDLVSVDVRLFPVGRLDYDTTGALLLTNNGYLANRLAHPRYKIDKVYEALVHGAVKQNALKQLQNGVEIEKDVVVRGETRILKKDQQQTLIEISVHEGKKRQIKRMMKAIEHPVIRLKRTRFAGLTVQGINEGEWRELREEEVDALYRVTGLKRKKEKG